MRKRNRKNFFYSIPDSFCFHNLHLLNILIVLQCTHSQFILLLYFHFYSISKLFILFVIISVCPEVEMEGFASCMTLMRDCCNYDMLSHKTYRSKYCRERQKVARNLRALDGASGCRQKCLCVHQKLISLLRSYILYSSLPVLIYN